MKCPTLVRLAALLVAAGGCPCVPAQDVTVGESVWAMPGPAPDVLPVAKHRLRPDYPDELRKTPEIGYVIIHREVDASGKGLSLEAVGTHVPFQRAVEEAYQEWDMRPAMRGGRPVTAAIWIPVIFNPRSAADDRPEATPRLLAVTPVITPGWPKRESASPVVRMRLSLDAAGAITQAVPESEVPAKTEAAIVSALKGWRFSPARQNGQPVAAELAMFVRCEQPPPPERTSSIPPKPIRQERPEYPMAMRRFGLRGQVSIDFIVDESGRVQNPIVAQSDNPAFDEPALKALRQWRFEPGTSNGKPVAARMRVPIVFDLTVEIAPGGFNQSDGRAHDAFEINQRGDQSKLPPELRYDTPPKIRGVMIPVYPYERRRDGLNGTAKAKILIDTQGRVAAVKVTAADAPEFGLALAAALEGFTFDPALKDGRPVPHLLSLEQEFNGRELPDEAADRLLAVEKKHPERIAKANALDAPLKPLSRRAPLFPTGLDEAVTKGSALIECVIDDEGRVRLPRVIEASEPAFGYAAVQAVAAWWFEPPKAGGKSVDVRVRIPFNFGGAPKKPGATPAPASDLKPAG